MPPPYKIYQSVQLELALFWPTWLSSAKKSCQSQSRHTSPSAQVCSPPSTVHPMTLAFIFIIYNWILLQDHIKLLRNIPKKSAAHPDKVNMLPSLMLMWGNGAWNEVVGKLNKLNTKEEDDIRIEKISKLTSVWDNLVDRRSGSVCPPSQFSHFSLPSDSSESAKGTITTWPKSFHWFQANVEIELTGTLFVWVVSLWCYFCVHIPIIVWMTRLD
jgi:hypothetical protein